MAGKGKKPANPTAPEKTPEKASDESRFRSNLLALVSHELNTPLTGILNSISVLEQRYPSDQEFLPMLRRNAERLRHTVANMLLLAEADAGMLRVHLSETKLENVLHREMERMRAHLERQGFRFNAEFEADLPTVCADPMRLGRVIDTFFANAVKFSDKHAAAGRKPEVKVRLSLEPLAEIREKLTHPRAREIASQTGMFLVVTVASSLPPLGEAPTSYEDFFEPFSPWKDIYTREKEGLGIELALAREILIAHHGFIAAGPPEHEGEGTVFYFGLPVLSRQDELEFVINNRIHGALGNLTKTSILSLRPAPDSVARAGDLRRLEEEVRNLLYRSSDSVFSNPATGEITIVMDDCNAKGAEKLAERLAADLRRILPEVDFVFGAATGPDQGATARELLDRAAHAWKPL